MTWLLIAIGVLFALGAAMTALRGNRQTSATRDTSDETRSYFGANNFEDTDAGVTFADVEPPGSPADKAGLVGGDIITTFDGQVVKNKGTMMSLLKQTPPGKIVEVIYVRDGETKKTQLKTISRQEFYDLAYAFDEGAGGRGLLGFNEGDSDTVPIEGTKLQGVRLGDIGSSGPAALAGLQEGDIITEFDGTPIRTVGELVSRVRRSKAYSTVKVIAFRGKEKLEISVKMGKRR